MPRKSRNNYNHKSRKGRAPRRGAVNVGGPRVTGMYMEKSRFPQLPHEVEFSLNYYYHDERTGGQTTQASRQYPLCEFDTTLPRYAAELYQIYRHARIMAIDLHMEIVNTSTTEPLLAAVGVLPLANVASITDPKQIVSVPGATIKQIGLATGMSKAVINKRYVTERCLGELTIGSNTYLQTYSEALSAAVWTELPCIYAGVIAARNGATWTGIIDYRVTYHLRFSEYNVPSLGYVVNSKQSFRGKQPFNERTSEMEENEEDYEWVQPPPLVRTKKKDLLNQSSSSQRPPK